MHTQNNTHTNTNLNTEFNTNFNNLDTTKRLTFEQGVQLLKNAPINTLANYADEVRQRLHPNNTVTFVADRNINYTNICAVHCSFCSFRRNKNDADAYVLSNDEIIAKINETKELGGTQILLQGGMHPEFKIDYYENLVELIKSMGMWVHGFSAAELQFVAQVSKISVREVMERLIAKGLDSIPGAADLLVEDVRKDVSPGKVSVPQWVDCMETAHELGLKTSSCLMFKKDDTAENIIKHLDTLRQLQDRTNGFTAFICWPFQPDNTKLGGEKTTPYEYLRVLAVARLYLDNIPNIQVSWVTQGKDIGQLGLLYGANDFGNLMIEENVVSAAGTTFKMSSEDIINSIQEAGFIAAKRDMHYNILETYVSSLNTEKVS